MNTIELERWKPSAENPGKMQYEGQRTAQEVYAELKDRLDSIGFLPDEYFLLDTMWNDGREIPEGADRGWFYFFVSLLDEFYWFLGATLGGILGGLLRFNTEGLDFVMTAMFVVIFMDQWLKEKHHFSAWIGLIASVACLLIFGADNFLIPTMICILVALTALRKPVEAKTQEAVK